MKKIFTCAAAALIGLAVAGAARADNTFLGSSGTTFLGSLWSLTYSGSALPDSDPLHETYRVKLAVDLGGYTGPGSYLDQVALSVSSAPVLAATLVDAPSGPAAWSLRSGALSNGGCNGIGGSWECANSTLVLNGGLGLSLSDPMPLGIDYVWVFDITMDSGTLLTGESAMMKARFVDPSGQKSGGLIIENIALTQTTALVSPVPEPETYAMMIAGLALLAFSTRRRRAAGRRLIAA